MARSTYPSGRSHSHASRSSSSRVIPGTASQFTAGGGRTSSSKKDSKKLISYIMYASGIILFIGVIVLTYLLTKSSADSFMGLPLHDSKNTIRMHITLFRYSNTNHKPAIKINFNKLIKEANNSFYISSEDNYKISWSYRLTKRYGSEDWHTLRMEDFTKSSTSNNPEGCNDELMKKGDQAQFYYLESDDTLHTYIGNLKFWCNNGDGTFTHVILRNLIFEIGRDSGNGQFRRPVVLNQTYIERPERCPKRCFESIQ